VANHAAVQKEGAMSSSDYIAIAGVAANLLVVLAAILVPMWQRRAILNDAKEANKQSTPVHLIVCSRA
jgi:hypothetical protein